MQDCQKLTGALWSCYNEKLLIMYGKTSAKCEKLMMFSRNSVSRVRFLNEMQYWGDVGYREYFNPVVPNGPFLYPLKTSENVTVS